MMCRLRHQITQNVSKIKVFNTKYCTIIALVGGESKMSASEMRKVLAAFLTHCPDAYTITGTEG